MVNQFLRWLRGYVTFTAVGKFPERLINLAMLSDIAIINPVGEKGKFTAQVSIADYKRLYNIRKRTMTHLKIKKKYGLPFLIYRNKKRKGLFVGAILFAITINILSMFIWTIDIKGNNRVSTYEIQCCLKDNGVYVGALKDKINVSSAERGFALELGKVGWMSVNIVGSTASVELSESYDVPEIVDATQPCNLKAKKTGQVLKMDIREGKNNVTIGDGVAKGQLLVSGIVEIGETGTSRFVHSEGEVYAGVITNEEVKIPKSKDFNSISQLPKRELISFMNFKIPIDYVSVNDAYSRKYVTHSYTLNDVDMPINIVTEYNFSKIFYNINYSKQQAEQLAKTEFAINDLFFRWDSDIQNQKIKTSETKDAYIFTAEYYSIENIAESVPITIIPDL